MYGCVQTSKGVKPTTKFRTMLSGGSLASWSVTWLARTVSVQVSPLVSEIAGSIVNVVGPPVTAASTVPLAEHTSVNQEAVTLTGSLKVTDRFAPTGKSVAPFAG